MIIVKNIDVSELSEMNSLSSSELDDLKEMILDSLISKLEFQWKQEVINSNLKQTKSEYLESIETFKEGRFRGGVGIREGAWLPNAIEEGVSSFDMKEGMLKSSKVKTNKNGGVYLTIPFRLSTGIGDSQIFSGVMPKEIYNKAKRLKIKSSLKFNQLPKQHQSLNKNIRGYEHKSPIYEGLTKLSGGKHAKYTSFRVISSTSSDANSWIHPGIIAHNLSNKAVEDIDMSSISEEIDNFLIDRGI